MRSKIWIILTILILAESCHKKTETVTIDHVHAPCTIGAVTDTSAITSKKTIGIDLQGGFANQLIQFAFANFYAERKNLNYWVNDWVGQEIFESPSKIKIAPLELSVIDYDRAVYKSFVAPTAYGFENTLIQYGYYQFHTRNFQKIEKECFRKITQYSPTVESTLSPFLKKLKEKGNTLVVFHLRRGDFTGQGPFVVSDLKIYLDWLKTHWENLDKPVLFLASNDMKKVLPEFSKYHPETSQSLGAAFPGQEFLADFYLMSKADVFAGSKNSSFSFMASMLNTSAKLFLMPDYQRGKSTDSLVAYDPWDSVFWDEDLLGKEAPLNSGDSTQQ